jgi:hypothetical protein
VDRDSESTGKESLHMKMMKLILDTRARSLWLVVATALTAGTVGAAAVPVLTLVGRRIVFADAEYTG